MQKIWYCKKPGGETFGPITQKELKRLAATKSLEACDIVWKEGSELRVQARNVGGLEEFYSQPKSPPPITRPPTSEPIEPESLGDMVSKIPFADILRDLKLMAIVLGSVFLLSLLYHLFKTL